MRQRYSTERPLVFAALAVAGLATLQILLGLTLTYLPLPQPAQVLHLAVASLLLGAETVALLLAWWLPPATSSSLH